REGDHRVFGVDGDPVRCGADGVVEREVDGASQVPVPERAQVPLFLLGRELMDSVRPAAPDGARPLELPPRPPVGGAPRVVALQPLEVPEPRALEPADGLAIPCLVRTAVATGQPFLRVRPLPRAHGGPPAPGSVSATPRAARSGPSNRTPGRRSDRRGGLTPRQTAIVA